MQGWQFLTFICIGSLFAVTGFRQFLLDPLADTPVNAAWFVVQVIPLLAPLPGFLSGSIRSTFLLCLFSLLYFIHGVMYAYEVLWLGLVEVFFALALCAITAFIVRKQREQAAAPEAE